MLPCLHACMLARFHTPYTTRHGEPCGSSPGTGDERLRIYEYTIPHFALTNAFHAKVRLKVDQRNVALVSRAWKDIMYPLMWEEFNTDMRTSSGKSLATLLHPQSEVLRHIRTINLLDGIDSLAEQHFQLLLSALPPSLLRDLDTESPLSSFTLKLLLQTQRSIESVYGPVCSISDYILSDDANAAEDAAWMFPFLAKLKSMTFYVQSPPEYASRARRDFQFFLTHTAPLEGLQVTGWPEDGSDDDEMSYIDLGAMLVDWDKTCDLSKLVWLGFVGVDLLLGSELFIDNLEPAKLDHFFINTCVNIVPVLTALANVFSSKPGQLTHLCIIMEASEPATEEPIGRLESLLEVCPCLRTLEIDVGQSRMIDLAVLGRHGSTLRSVVLGTARSDVNQTYSPAIMGKLLETCLGLKYLAIDLPDPDLGPVSSLAGDFALDNTTNDLTRILVGMSLVAVKIRLNS
jgi:hypothetical protein